MRNLPSRRRIGPASPLIEIRRSGRLGGYADGLDTACRRWLRLVCAALRLESSHEISVLLTDSPTIRRLNRRWRGKDRPTDVLSFPLQNVEAGQAPESGPIGDIVIALPVARRAARELNLDSRRHLAHLLVHGLLHLLGYDHHRKHDAERMESLERTILDQIP